MINKQTIEEIALKHLESSGLFLVEVNCSVSNEIEVVVDADNYLTIDDCIKLSKAIEGELDREAEDFELSVYSAGIGQPLKIHRQYLKTIGRPVELILKSGLKITGTLTAVTQDGLSIEYQVKETVEGKKRKELVTKTENYTFDQIKSTKEELTIR